MAPNQENDVCLLADEALELRKLSETNPKNRQWHIVWKNVVLISLLHIAAFYGLYLSFTHAMFKTFVFGHIYGNAGALGITAGAHRLWAHRSYKARWPLRVILMLFNCIAVQDAVIHWARDHRTHHRYSETDADPHNATRGFFFSHVGWLLIRKHPETKAKGRSIDLSDLYADPVLRFQKKHYTLLIIVVGVVIPLYLSTLFGETLWNSLFISVFLRYVVCLNYTWSVNSVAHLWGRRPYDKNINPVENKVVSLVALGEGHHNYHHIYPWDYKTAELGGYSLNITKLFIDMMAMIGWAYDLKTVPRQVIEERKKRTGDGTKQ